MEKMGRQGRRRSGYTLAEVLVVVAILGVLAAVAIPSILSYRRALKLTELDDSARTIYLAAQNRLSALRSASGGTPLKFGGTSDLSAQDVPAEAVSEGVTAGLKYVSTDDSGAQPGWLVLPGSVDSDLTQAGSHYLVEFDPASGVVYGVFYTEEPDGKALTQSVYQNLYSFTSGGKSCRVRDGREAFAKSSDGFLVGYYGADGALDLDRLEGTALPTPKLKLTNNEELVLTFSATAQDVNSVFYSVSVTGADASGNDCAKTLVEKGVFNSGATNTLVLDTLKSEQIKDPGTPAYGGWTVSSSFAGWVGDDSIVPGANITVTVTVWYQPDADEGISALPKTAAVTANSLFGQRRNVEMEDGTTATQVEVGYGRHLQNLGAAGLDSAITQAVQVQDIDFEAATPDTSGDEGEYWAETYGGQTFVPIENDNLKGYDGQGRVITHLNAAQSGGNTGLFGTLNGATVKDVTLADAKATGKIAGSLAGVVQNTTVDNCRAYILPDSATGRYSTVVRVNGITYAGGLIGQAVNSTISGSFAATVVSGDGSVGGLVGLGGNLKVNRCYAAGSLSGDKVGGLVGAGLTRIENCYAAGTIFKAGSTAAGLTAGWTNAYSSYAAVEYVDVADAQVYGAVPTGNGCTDVYYLAQYGVNDAVEVSGVTLVAGSAEMVKADKLSALTAFQEDPPDETYPYNHVTRAEEDGPLAAPYPYPTLGDLPHYGDWLETGAPAQPQSLIAYYEQFQTDSVSTEYSYILDGEEKGTLDLTRTGAISADGYAFLSAEKLNNSWENTAKLTVTAVGKKTLENTVSATYLGALDEALAPAAEDADPAPAYYVYAIPTSAIDTVPNGGYYVEVTVQATSAIQNYNGEEPAQAEATAWINPLFGRSAYNGSKPSSAPDAIHIRSLRQLANIGRFYGTPTYIQDLDIDAQLYKGDLAFDANKYAISQAGLAVNSDGHVTVAGFEMWGCYSYSTEWNYMTNMYYLPEDYRLIFTPLGSHGDPAAGGYDTMYSFNGTYDGNDRIIRALRIPSYFYAADEAYYTGLFYRVISGTLKNINLQDSEVIGATGADSDATGALVGRLSSTGQLLDCTVTNCTVTVEGAEAGGHVGGAVGYADNGALLVRGCTVANSTVDGGSYAHNVGGFVGYVNKLTPSKTGDGGAIQDCTVTDVAVSGGFVGKDSVTNVSKMGTAGGFVGCMQNNTGTVENCAVIGTGGLSVSGTTRASGGFAGIVESGSVQSCAVRLEGTPKTGYAAQGVSGGQSSGGFAGMVSGGSISASYAAVKVDGANAGGFAGTLSGGSVSNCYAGGHTKNGKYSASLPNVTGTGQTGGFVGLWKGGSLDTCYTTCAVSGPSDNATDVFVNRENTGLNSVKDCYALGAAFVDGSSRSELNEVNVAVTMPELAAEARAETHAYDTALTENYPYTPVQDADGNAVPHYGDWPSDSAAGQGFEWTPVPETFDSAAGLNLSTEADWNGNDLTLTFVTTGSGSTLSNQFAQSGGCFTITTDLGYVMVLKVVENGDGSCTIYEEDGADGKKLCDITIETEGEGDNLRRTYTFTVPTADLPPYLASINIRVFKGGYVLENITNNDPTASDYKPVESFKYNVVIDGDFSDWDGYPHQLLDWSPGNAGMGGTAEGAAFGNGNLIYVHVLNKNKNDRVSLNEDGEYVGTLTIPITNLSFNMSEDGQWSSRSFEWWRFTNLEYTGPGIYVWKEDKWNTTTWPWQSEGSSIKGECYLKIYEDGSQEMEMLFYLDEMVGEETANKIDGVTINFSTIGGSLTITRELE